MKKNLLFIISAMATLNLYSQVIDPQPGLSKEQEEEKKKATIIESDGKEKKVDITFIDNADNPKGMIYGLTALNSSSNDALSSLNGTGRLGIAVFPTKKNDFKINMAVNMLNAKPPKGVSRDSVDFNSLMFPETGNFGFLFSPSVRLTKINENNSIWAEGSFAYRKVSVDSPNVSFNALSYNLGLKYKTDFTIGQDKTPGVVTIMPYWNLFNIPNEDVNRFTNVLKDSLFKDVNKGAEIYSFGIKTAFQYKNFIFFFDIRNNTNTKDLDDDNPFKGTKINIGFITAFSLKEF